MEEVRQLRVPIRNMLVALPFALLAKSRNHITQRTQTLVDILRLAQAVLVARRAAFLQALAAREVDEVQAAFAGLARERVLAPNAKGEHGVRARGALVHERRGDGAAALREREERAHLRRGGERDDVRVGDGCAPGFGVVLDVVPLLVELAFAEEVVDGFVVLENMIVIGDRNGENERNGLRSRASGPPSYTPSPWP